MRLHPALALAAVLLPALAVAQTDEWVRDDMTDESLWLVRTGNLALEPSTAGVFPGAPERGSQWVVSKGDGPAYVVYFLPGRIHEVEIDTHRLAGAAGDFTLAVSTDGNLYQPINAGSVLLDSSFGWDYRLMASDQIPENATHLLVQFPNGSTAHRLSEVWIRYTWDDALVNHLLPAPVAPPPVQSEFSLQSDADLQLLLDQLMAAPRQTPAPTAGLLETKAPGAPVSQASVAAAAPYEYAPAIAQPETVPEIEEEEDLVEEIDPALVVVDTMAPGTAETMESGDENVAPHASATVDEAAPTIIAQIPAAEDSALVPLVGTLDEVAINDREAASAAAATEESALHTDATVAAESEDEPEEPVEPAVSLPEAPAAKVASSEPGTTEIDVAEFSSRAESNAGILTAASAVGTEELTANVLETGAPEGAPSQPGVSEIDVAEFAPRIETVPALEAAAPKNDASESIEIEPLAIGATAPGITATSGVHPSTEPASTIETVDSADTEVVATPAPAPATESAGTGTGPSEIAVAKSDAPSAPATESTAAVTSTTTETVIPATEDSLSAVATSVAPAVSDAEVVSPEPTFAEVAPVATDTGGTESNVIADLSVSAPSDGTPPVLAPEPEVATVEPPPEVALGVDVIDRAAFAQPEAEVAAIPSRVVADSPATDSAPGEPEQVWRLPPFDLPILSSSRPLENADAIAEPSPSQSEASNAPGLPPAQETQPVAEEIVVSSSAVDPAGTQPPDIAATVPELAAPALEPAAPPESGPMLIAAAEVAAIEPPEAAISEGSEPDHKPALKVRRIGPRSKSRDHYSGRG